MYTLIGTKLTTILLRNLSQCWDRLCTMWEHLACRLNPSARELVNVELGPHCPAQTVLRHDLFSGGLETVTEPATEVEENKALLWDTCTGEAPAGSSGRERQLSAGDGCSWNSAMEASGFRSVWVGLGSFEPLVSILPRHPKAVHSTILNPIIISDLSHARTTATT